MGIISGEDSSQSSALGEDFSHLALKSPPGTRHLPTGWILAGSTPNMLSEHVPPLSLQTAASALCSARKPCEDGMLDAHGCLEGLCAPSGTR